LGEDERKLLLARAIQVFMPGVPQVWYLDLFAGKNDYAAADAAGSGGHKEINRTSLSLDKVEAGLKRNIVLKQLEILQLRNTSKAFSGNVLIADSKENEVIIHWSNQFEWAELRADLQTQFFTIAYTEKGVTIKKSYNNIRE
jgi:sucrose phosphorylase